MRHIHVKIATLMERHLMHSAKIAGQEIIQVKSFAKININTAITTCRSETLLFNIKT